MNRKRALEMTREEYGVSAGVQARSIINEVYNDFENRTCENCEYYKDFKFCDLMPRINYIYDGFGCNKFAKKVLGG